MRRFRSRDGTDLAYRVVGSGPLLVCVPGGPGQAVAYLGDLGGLSTYRTLVLLDNRGTGWSERPQDARTYRVDRLVQDVEALRGHFPWVDDPALFAAIVHEFLARGPAPPAA
jgi:pimeloyl-ACP methyl ester carboxylesterase